MAATCVSGLVRCVFISDQVPDINVLNNTRMYLETITIITAEGVRQDLHLLVLKKNSKPEAAKFKKLMPLHIYIWKLYFPMWDVACQSGGVFFQLAQYISATCDALQFRLSTYFGQCYRITNYTINNKLYISRIVSVFWRKKWGVRGPSSW